MDNRKDFKIEVTVEIFHYGSDKNLESSIDLLIADGFSITRHEIQQRRDGEFKHTFKLKKEGKLD